MIYQGYLKRCAAAFNGVSFSDYASLSYGQWAEIRADYLKTHDLAGRSRQDGAS